MQRVQPTPLHLARLVILGSAIALVACAVTFLPFPEPLFHHGLAAMLWSVRLELLCAVLPLCAGLGCAYWNNHRLSSGINRLRFTEEELDEVRQLLKQPWLRTSLLVSTIGLFALVVIMMASPSHTNHWSIFFVLSMNPISYLRANLGKQPAAHTPIDWTISQPIHSDRWGQTL